MTCGRCVWTDWFPNKLTGAWFRTCKRCGTFERSATAPMQKVSVQARKAGQQFRADWKEKQSGD